MPGWNWQFIKQKLSNTLRLSFWQKCLNKQVGEFYGDYMINCNENENDNENRSYD